MSEKAKRHFKKTSARMALVRVSEERTLLSGPAKHRVTGAGKHLRVLDTGARRKLTLGNLTHACGGLGLPDNFHWSKDLSENDIRRISGWLSACADHPPAMVVLGSLFDLNNGRGVESHSHAGGHATIPWLMQLWVTPLHITGQQASAMQWLVKASRYSEWEGGHFPSVVDRVKNVKLLEQLHKLTPLARWAIASKLPKEGDVTHRDLDWEFLASLRRKEMLEHVPYMLRLRAQWRDLGVQTPKDVSCSPRGVAIGTMRVVQAWVIEAAKGFFTKKETKDRFFSKPENFDAALRLALLFGRDSASCVRYLEAYLDHFTTDLYNNRGLAMHDAAQKLPVEKVSGGWKSFVVNNFTSPFYSDIMDNMSEVEEVCGGVPTSVGEARHKFMMAGIPWSFDLNPREREFVLANPPKLFEMCPDVSLREGEYRLVKLDAGDTRQLTAGRLTDCCQHLLGAGSACAMLAWTSPACAIYAVFKGERMVAQTFAWRGEDGSLVFDSIEALRNINKDAVLPLFAQAAEQLLGKLGVTWVLVGNTNYGITEEFSTLYARASVRTPAPMVKLGYSDASHGCKVVCEAITMPPIDGEEPDPVVDYGPALNCVQDIAAVNELMEDSDVFCEHCDTEVHPACQICPSCGQDISEWV